MALPRTLAPSEDTVLESAAIDASVPHDAVQETDLVIVTCPRCGHADRMLAMSYALWIDGILCGLCGPPYVKMRITSRQRHYTL
jgi:hypothetical protein